MTVKKFKLWLAPNISKEEEWLTEMSQKGLHLTKYRFFTYHFEEDPTKSYTYQIDFRQGAKYDYFQLYKDAGWDHITEVIGVFHYFRTESTNSEVKKIYSDNQSIQDSYIRMRGFYLLIFILFLVSQIGALTSWSGWPRYIVIGVDVAVIVIYLHLFYVFNKRINFYRKL
ncbi:DUF2812 domain-containing protein [Ornithinibacillus halotolerans]|uniref:DUF2812 domain-containing protein n=1 Tax=Ornithinibacillus halotolerans TaxID=1274357 RepID=A0A916S0P4_9BACI|nr:DUF2812 domain-containing protein [Ornithinibacillus halotolerans]GGA78303.1 hypothetical protein GCM10008025_22240 [Ornithinibacillus halotolerans]